MENKPETFDIHYPLSSNHRTTTKDLFREQSLGTTFPIVCLLPMVADIVETMTMAGMVGIWFCLAKYFFLPSFFGLVGMELWFSPQ